MSPDRPAGLAGAPAAAGGVIHDLGFRHYTGPRLGAAVVARALAWDSLRGAFGLGRSTRSKIMPMLLLAVCAGVALVTAVVVNVLGLDSLPLSYPEYPLALSPVVTLFVAGQAPAAVSRDLRSRVVSLYFSRPLTRTDYVRAKYVALTGALFVLTGLPLLLLYAGALLAEMPFWEQTRSLLQGLLVAALLSVALAGISLVIAAITPRRGVGVAAVVTTLVMLTGVQGVLQVLGEEQGLPGLVQYSRLASPFGMVDGVLTWLFDVDTGSGLARPSTAPGLACLAAVGVLALVSYLLLLARYRRVSVS